MTSIYDMNMQRGINPVHKFNVLLTNARSLSPKISSLHTCFAEHKIDVAMITESWLRDGTVLDRDIIDLEWGTNLKIIYKNRPRTPAGRRKVGGGVSIIFNKASCNLRERKIKGNNFELVLAIGRVGKLSRQSAFFCVYIEPRMKVGEVEQLCDLIAGEILQLKAKGNPYIFVGGDLNRKDLTAAFQDFDDMKQINSEPTRGDACLDILFSNCDALSYRSWPPLETPDGVKSDHLCTVFSGEEPHVRNFKWVSVMVRKQTDRAVEEFGRRLASENWSEILPEGGDPNDLVDRFHEWSTAVTNELFPLRRIRKRSNEHPWVTNGVRRVAKMKRRVYRREGKSPLWKRLDEHQERLLEDSKKAYVDKASESGTSTRVFFQTVKKLGKPGEDPNGWGIGDIFPEMTELGAGEEAVNFFTRISNTFTPLPEQDGEVAVLCREPISEGEVAKRLKLAKKPSSTVQGDVPPCVVRKHHQHLAVPARIIFNSVFRTGKWPRAWKNETTVVIPKVNNPESLAECRNISCTNFLSKVMEGVVLDDLRSQIPVDPAQYGGIKDCSVNHLLVDLMEQVLEPLEGGASSIVLRIDYEKAFNRLDHAECLEQLRLLGASGASLNLVRSFLTGRTMCVKVGNQLTSRRVLSGGSPQGSILGCYLYCSATQHVGLSLPRAAPRTPLSSPQQSTTPVDVVDRGTPDEEGFGLMEEALQDNAGSPNTSDDSFHTAVGSGSFEEMTWETLMALFKYVDDTTTIETIPPDQHVRHIGTATPTERLMTPGTKEFIQAVIARTAQIGMLVNCKKTQMLAVSPDNGYEAWASFEAGGATITTQPNMKLLGFMLGSKPGAAAHVELLRAKFRARFWTLIHLRRAGLSGLRLFKLYAALVRPVIEANSVIYHPMLTVTQDTIIERMQKQVCRLCFGITNSYDEAKQIFEIDTLRERRTKAMRRFVSKAMRNPRFADRWFIRRQEVGTELRRRRPFIEKKAKTTRYQNSPLVQMQKIANDLMTEAQG